MPLKKLKYAFCIICLAFLLFTACHKDPPAPAHPATSRLIPDELKAYWNFKPGSYWIYKDSLSGNTDSIYVTGYKNYTGRGTLSYSGDSVIYEYLELDTHSSLDGYDYDYGVNTQYASNTNPDFNLVSISKLKTGYSSDTHDCFLYPLTKGLKTELGYGTGADDTCIIRNIYNSYNGYSNVVQVDHSENSFEKNYAATKSFYAKNIGLIRYEVPAYNVIKKLVAYHIN